MPQTLLELGFEVPELMNHTHKDLVFAELVDPRRAWWYAWPGAPRLPSWNQLEVARIFVGARDEFEVAVADGFTQWLEAPAELRAAMAMSLCQHDLEPLERAFRQSGLPFPAQSERRRAEWERLIEAIVGRAEGLAALIVVTGRTEWADVFSESSQQVVREASVLLQQAAERHDFPEVTSERVRQWCADFCSELDADLEEIPLHDVAVEGVLSWLLALANLRQPGGVTELLDQLTRPISVAGHTFIGPKEARRFLEDHESEIPLHPEELELTGTDKVVEPQAAEPGRQGRGRRGFSARAGVVGEMGERYVKRVIENRGAEWRVWDVSTRDAARRVWDELQRLAAGDSPLASWATAFTSTEKNTQGRYEYPGFDLLAIRIAGHKVAESQGIEVKCTDVDVMTLDFEWSENEYHAALTIREYQRDSETKLLWCWPVEAYHLVCVTRLWQPAQSGGFMRPRLLVLKDPLGLGAQLTVTRFTSVTHRVQVDFPIVGPNPTLKP